VSRSLAVLLAVAAGCFVGLQAPVNARLGREVGALQAATISFTIGLLALVVVAAINSVIGAYYYLRVIVAMYFWEPSKDYVPTAVAPALSVVVLAVPPTSG